MAKPSVLNDIWQQAVDQLEEVKEALLRGRTRIEDEVLRLRRERDRLLINLGEETYRLANQGKFPVPDVIKRTVERLNDVIEHLVKTEKKSGGRKKKTTKKASAGTKKAAKKTAKKTTKKTTKKAGTRTSKKTTKKQS